MKREKQGISLIVLVLTIIIMIILAAAVIITLSNSNIIERADNAVAKTDMAQIQELASIAWTEAYADGKKTQTELEKAVMDSLEANGVKDKDLENYIVDVTTEGVEIRAYKTPVPSEWAANVTAVVDTVPIPKSFVVSPYDGENTKNEGLVIYELKEGETAIPSTEEYETSLTTRNQYVWIPVDSDTFDTTFVRKDFGASYNSLLLSDQVVTGRYLWEPTPATENTEENLVFATEYTLSEVKEMYASVKEYGGFFIARWTAEDFIPGYCSVKNNDGFGPGFNASMQKARSIYPNSESNTTGVISTLTYGVQWDRVIAWLIETEAKDANGNKIDVTRPTKVKNISNIYAMDTGIWTMERLLDQTWLGVSERTAAYRNTNDGERQYDVGSRVTLYIKI